MTYNRETGLHTISAGDSDVEKNAKIEWNAKVAYLKERGFDWDNASTDARQNAMESIPMHDWIAIRKQAGLQ